MNFFVKNTKAQIRRKTSRFVNNNLRKFENLYILLRFINTIGISKSIKIYKPITHSNSKTLLIIHSTPRHITLINKKSH